MKIRLPFILPVILFTLLFACSKEKQDDAEVLAKINDFKLTQKEFQYKLANEVEMDRDFKLTKEARKDFLEDIIRTELLIQEAKAMNLDKKERFIRTIEKYWESTLIRDLMEKKGEEISRTITISQDEIRDRYNNMKKQGGGLPPLEAVEESIREQLKEEKKTRKLKEWIDGLRKDAKIEINKKLLYEN